MSPRSRQLAFTVAILTMLTSTTAADAGWVTFKNDTSKAVVVQEYVVVNGKKIHGRPTKLLPGESCREFHNMPGIKHYDILDAANTTSPLWSGPLSCKSDSQTFSILALPTGITIKPISEVKKP